MKQRSPFQPGRAFLIAEIGSNHDQDLETALALIDAAADCGADAVKFQSILPDKLLHLSQCTEKDRILYERIQLPEDWYPALFARAKENDVLCFSAPTYLEAVRKLAESGAQLMKIASPQTYGFPQLIDEVAKTGLPTLLSTGYCRMPEIERAVTRFAQNGSLDKLILLHCVSNYPTRFEDMDLRFMDCLAETFSLPVGLSDHTPGWSAAVAAVARGACTIEKHITFSRTRSGPDHHFAMEIPEFRELVTQIRNVEAALGSGTKACLTPFELAFRESVMEYPFARHEIAAGSMVRREDLYFRRTKTGGALTAWDCDAQLLGHRTKHPIAQDEQIAPNDVEAAQ